MGRKALLLVMLTSLFIAVFGCRNESTPIQGTQTINANIIPDGVRTIDIVMRLDAPDLEKINTWLPPKAETPPQN